MQGKTASHRPCENSNARRVRRNIFYKLRIMRNDDAADMRFDAASEKCIFYISPMSEFSHGLLAAVSPKSDKMPHWDWGIAAQNVSVSNRSADVFVAAAIVS